MDQELIAYLEERFRENARQVMEGVRSELGTLRQEMRGEMGTLRQEMREEVGTLREEMREEVGTLRQEMMSRFEQVDEALRENRDEIRHTQENLRHSQIVMESMRSDIQGVAEGVLSANQRIDSLREEMKQEIGKVGDRIDLSHKAHKDLNKRVLSLEEWRKRFGEDPVPHIRKKSAKKS